MIRNVNDSRTATATAQTKRLLELYRREQEHWSDREMLESMLECSANMLAGTVANCATKLLRPRCSRSAVAKMAEYVIREMVDRGHAADIEAFIEQQARVRVDANTTALPAWMIGELVRDPELLNVVAGIVRKFRNRKIELGDALEHVRA